jgi:hypothetical protein
MERMFKPSIKKNFFFKSSEREKNCRPFLFKRKAALKKIIQHLVHPGYILFDWEFYSNALEFE